MTARKCGGARKGAGRPSAGIDDHLHIRMSTAVKRELGAAARANGQTLTAWVLGAIYQRYAVDAQRGILAPVVAKTDSKSDMSR